MAWLERRVTRTSQPQELVGVDSGWHGCEVFSPAIHSTGLSSKITVSGIAVVPTASNTVLSGSQSLSLTTRTLVSVVDFSGPSSTGIATSFGDSVTLIKNNNTSAKLLISTVAGGDSYSSNFTVPSTPFVLVVNVLFGGSGYAAYINSVLVASGAFSGVFKSNTLRLGGNDFGNGGSSTAVLMAAMKSGLSSTFDEIKSLSDNPWQIFEPEIEYVWVDALTAAGDATAMPAGVASSGSVGTPAATGAATAMPAGVASSGSVGTPVATGAANSTPAGVASSGSVGTPVATGGTSIPATVVPSGVSATSTIGAPEATGAASISIAGLGADGSVGTPSVTGSAVADAAGVSEGASVGAPSATGAAQTYLAGVQADAFVGTPSALGAGAATVTPEGVQAIGAVGTFIATGSAWCLPSGVAAAGLVGAPTATGGSGSQTVSINYLTKVIHIPRDFMTLVSPTLYELDVNELRLALKDIEDDPEGMFAVDTHRHNTSVVLSGVTYARTFEIINGYTVQFEEGQYAVRCVGANHNLADVKVLNQVSLIIGNSAGLVEIAAAGGGGGGGGGSSNHPSAAVIAETVWAHALEGLTAEQMMRVMFAALAGKRQGLGTATEEYMARNGTTPRITLTADEAGNGTPVINWAP